jgi:hypothetical protein
MADEQITDHIEALVQEEHALYAKGETGGLAPEDHARLEVVRVELDRAYDLLRQRRALRAAGRDPNTASERDADTVEHYLQ